MAKDRSRDDRRTVGSHEKMMGALGKAAGWKRYEAGGGREFAIRADNDQQILGEHPHTAFIPGASTSAKYSTGDAVNTAMSSVDKK